MIEYMVAAFALISVISPIYYYLYKIEHRLTLLEAYVK